MCRILGEKVDHFAVSGKDYPLDHLIDKKE